MTALTTPSPPGDRERFLASSLLRQARRGACGRGGAGVMTRSSPERVLVGYLWVQLNRYVRRVEPGIRQHRAVEDGRGSYGEVVAGKGRVLAALAWRDEAHR